MTPERKEEIKRDAQSGRPNEDAFILNQEVLELLAALEETEQQNERLRKNFMFSGSALAEAQQTIARQREALEDIGHGPIKLVDGQLRDDLSRLWCACGQPAVHQVPHELPQYQFQCAKCSEGWEAQT